MKKLLSSVVLMFSFIVIVLLTFNVSSVFAIGSTPEANNMRLVGFNNLQARSAYQPIIHKQGDRWIAYIGHHGGSAVNPQTGNVEPNGTSIVDVTDPTRPRYLKHLPGGAGVGEAGGAQMVRACNGSDLPNADKTKIYLLRATSNSHEVYDVTDPSNPKLGNWPAYDNRRTTMLFDNEPKVIHDPLGAEHQLWATTIGYPS